MVFNANFNNISVIVVVSFICGGTQSTQRRPLTRRHAASRLQTLSHNVVIVASSTPHMCLKSGLTSHYGFGNKLCILWQLCYIVAVRFIGGGNWSTRG